LIVDLSTIKVKNKYFKIKFGTENIELGESTLKNDYILSILTVLSINTYIIITIIK